VGEGSYEGEGTATRCGGRLRLALRMTNEEPVRQFAAVVAEGEDAYDAANSLRPWLSAVRRVQLERVFRAEA